MNLPPAGVVYRLSDRRPPKCADLDTDALLGLIGAASLQQDPDSMGWVFCWDFPDDRLIPWKVYQAKLRRLIRRGWLSGCGCGCRGDYTLTKRSIARLVDRGVLSDPQAARLRRFADLNGQAQR